MRRSSVLAWLVLGSSVACTFSLHDVVDATSDAGASTETDAPATVRPDAEPGRDAEPARDAGAEAAAEAGPLPRFCDQQPASVRFCNDFDGEDAFGTGWQDITPANPPLVVSAVDDDGFESPPASAHFGLGAVPDGGVGIASANAVVPEDTAESFTLDLDFELRHFEGGDSFNLVYVSYGDGGPDLFVSLATADGQATAATLWEEGPVQVQPAAFGTGPVIGGWNHLSIRIDAVEGDNAYCTVELTKPGGSAIKVFDRELANFWTPGTPAFSLGIPFAASTDHAKDVRVDNVTLEVH